jgi:hypothetical protein
MDIKEFYKKRHKYNAKKTEYNGVMFDSKKEANRAMELDLLIRGKVVEKVEYQPVFDCIIEDKKICKYKADFKVFYLDGHIEYEDVKGCKKCSAYSMFRLKKKLVEALFNVKIIEI